MTKKEVYNKVAHALHNCLDERETLKSSGNNKDSYKSSIVSVIDSIVELIEFNQSHKNDGTSPQDLMEMFTRAIQGAASNATGTTVITENASKNDEIVPIKTQGDITAKIREMGKKYGAEHVIENISQLDFSEYID
jgi:1,4-dihydroxy-2-naphthoyl-CoA synthase